MSTYNCLKYCFTNKKVTKQNNGSRLKEQLCPGVQGRQSFINIKNAPEIFNYIAVIIE